MAWTVHCVAARTVEGHRHDEVVDLRIVDNRKHVLGLDLGTTAVKAGIVDSTGEVVASSSHPYETSIPRRGWAEQDPRDWWSCTCLAIREAIEIGGLDGGSLLGVGVSGQMHGSVFLDENGRVLRPCILWCDQRSHAQCQLMEELIGRKELGELVANPPLAGFTAPKILWLKENEKSNYGAVETLLLPKDYINFRLTGVIGTDYSDASGTLLLDVRNRCWSGPLLKALQIEPRWLPALHGSAEVLGEITREASRETGLRAGTPVAAGGADNACSAIGMGVVSAGKVAISIGSSGTVLAPVPSLLVDPDMRLHSFCHAPPDTWYLMGVMLSAGLSLKWFADQMGEPEKSRATEKGESVYRALVNTASLAPAGSEGLVFLPYLSGERTPHSNPNARGVLFGLDSSKTRAHVIRSILEGVAFGIRDSLQLIRSLGVPLEQVVLGGGGSRSVLWRQIVSDVCGMPLCVTRESDTAMLGAALLAGVAGGVFESIDEACRASVSMEELLEPDARNRRAYDRSYAVFRSLYPRLEDLFEMDV